MAMHFVLIGGNALYTGSNPAPPTTSSAVQGFTNWAVATISRYAGKGILWEVYNEADMLDVRHWTVQQYATLLKSVGQAVRAKSAIRSELIVGPSASFVNCAYVQQLKNLGALQHVDAVAVHSYTAGGPEQMRPQYAAMKQLLGSIPVISGEWGWATCSVNGQPSMCHGGTMPDVVSPSQQAMYVARQWLVNALEGIPVSIYYEYTNDSNDQTNAESNYGLRLSNSGTAKPAYHAAVAVQKHFGSRPFLSQLGDSSKMQYVLAFGPAGSGPPAAAAAGLEAGGAVGAFAVWTLSTTGGTATQTGSADKAYCAGDALFTGMASDCEDKCKETLACRGFVSYSTGSVHANSNCQLTGSPCTVYPGFSGCGININHDLCGAGDDIDSGGGNHTGSDALQGDPACVSARAYTLHQSATPPPGVCAGAGCSSAFDVLGNALPAVCAAYGKLTVHAPESPIYLVSQSGPAPGPTPGPARPTPGPSGPTPKPLVMYKCNTAKGECAADPFGKQSPGECIATCTAGAPTPAPPAPTPAGYGCVQKGSYN
jgi:hypothetical protein